MCAGLQLAETLKTKGGSSGQVPPFWMISSSQAL